MTARRIPLRLRGIDCPILLARGLASRLDALLPAGAIGFITDENVDRLHGACLPADGPRVVLPPGEATKRLEVVERIFDRLLDAGLDRAATLVAFGGGVIGDVAGLAAALFMRGVRWVNVPTTLLAMVDASIGGKTAVNLARGKNLAGAFHVPAMVVVDPSLLDTLPPVERASGMAEVIKHGVVGDPALFARLEARRFDPDEDIEAAVRVKAAIVERDPIERGERAVLNFGHTVGHGLERASGYALSHGHAVAVGMIAETRLAERLAMAAPGVAARIARVVAQYGLPTTAPVAAERARAAMQLDKKRVDGTLRFALPREIGRVEYGVEVDEGLLMEVLAEACEG